jgi:hypothetical protein
MPVRENNTSVDSDYVDESEPERKRIKLEASGARKRRARQKQSELQRQNTVAARGPSPFSHHPASGHIIGLSYFLFRII